MLDFCIRYVTYLDRLLIDGIKWLADNDYLYYAIMCLIPFVGTTIHMIKESEHDYQVRLNERYRKLEQASTADISKLLEIYSHEEYIQMKKGLNDEQRSKSSYRSELRR